MIADFSTGPTPVAAPADPVKAHQRRELPSRGMPQATREGAWPRIQSASVRPAKHSPIAKAN